MPLIRLSDLDMFTVQTVFLASDNFFHITERLSLRDYGGADLSFIECHMCPFNG